MQAKRIYHSCLAAAAVSLACTAAAETSADAGNVRLKGPLGARLDAMIERQVTGFDIDYITAPFADKTERRSRWQT